MTHEISTKNLTIPYLSNFLKGRTPLSLSTESIDLIKRGRLYLENKLNSTSSPIYGINTGFGSLYNISVNEANLEKLQYNLIVSHACGMGDKVPIEITRLILFLKIQSLSYGNSGITIEVVERLVDMFNKDIIPVIYTQGSLGASGDLAPLAHLSLPLLGLGEVYFEDEIQNSSVVLEKLGWEPLHLRAKEGLALLNGTQFIQGYSVYIAIQSLEISNKANQIAALSLDGYDGRIEPFDALIGQIRPHAGHIQTSAHIRKLLEDSEIISQSKTHVQDPYSFRCIPQVHGASLDTLNYFISVIEVEINSVTDNPNIFVEEDKIISAGNFHAQPLALPLDFLAIALAEWGSISERRIYLLLSGQRGLPLYLVANPGLNSGFMIAQYTAASIVSQNKQYATPASIDSIVSSNGQEDHVSMGANAATKCLKIVENVKSILGIEAMTACQAIDFRKPLKTSSKNQELYNLIRKEVEFIKEDIMMYERLNDCVRVLFN
ncbi:MAG: histidine ammonia-lyase [Chitinophagales bacterium]|jgi:histidine ammonia-lyase|nr:histidine ammonia-lyase [Sphingobacteriales bacterium]